ncbi:hypothetical protein LT85_1745 [Collimonas arenae]|uniref:Uncharacterized protein n=1 Tax=Collimonas arenae TaxID=279058 RepID=A0A0A1F857_9BURK|nr:hypothetical protein [Collimonas arenae]AIY40903.1 hypothetical protein LT85_1745 [Collimonas arenae]
MILTIASEHVATTSSDIADSLAASLARRRARAGRNVLLVYQNPAMTPKQDTTTDWLATEIKTGAEIRTITVNDIGVELAAAKSRYHDILVHLPKRPDAGSHTVLAGADLALFAIPADESHGDSQLTASVYAASIRNPALQLLVLTEDNAAGRSIMSALAKKIAHIRFSNLSAKRRDDVTISALYHVIYANCAATCAS